MPAGSGCTWPLRVSRQAAKDFDNLNSDQRQQVVRCLGSLSRREKWMKLRGTHDLWRVKAARGVRLVVNVQRGVAYVWRIDLRRDVYGSIWHQDSRVALTGITVEEFLEKSGLKRAV